MMQTLIPLQTEIPFTENEEKVIKIFLETGFLPYETFATPEKTRATIFGLKLKFNTFKIEGVNIYSQLKKGYIMPLISRNRLKLQLGLGEAK